MPNFNGKRTILQCLKNQDNNVIDVIDSLKKEPELVKYREIIAEQKRRGSIEKIDSQLPNDHTVHFLPHFPVKKDSVTNPIQIVYDCSCRKARCISE